MTVSQIFRSAFKNIIPLKSKNKAKDETNLKEVSRAKECSCLSLRYDFCLKLLTREAFLCFASLWKSKIRVILNCLISKSKMFPRFFQTWFICFNEPNKRTRTGV